jgi:hypothetical protein
MKRILALEPDAAAPELIEKWDQRRKPSESEAPA